MNEEKWLLNCFNEELRKGEKPVTRQEAKGMYIPKERFYLEEKFGTEVVTAVFGKATCLERAESMLLEIEKEKVAKQTKYEYLIDIEYRISDACGRRDCHETIWEKYAILHSEIPIKIFESIEGTSVLYYGLYKKTEKVTADELNKAKTWLSQSHTKDELEKKAYFEYIFELVYISLRKIFQEVKQEIMEK